MTERNGDTIRTVAWLEIFPWIRIAKAFPLAISVRALVFGALGVLLTSLGWCVIGGSLQTDSPATEWMEPYVVHPWKAVTDDIVPNRPPDVLHRTGEPKPCVVAQTLWDGNPMYTSWAMLTRPALDGLSTTGLSQTPPRAIACVLLSGLWAAMVWALFGAAICRGAAVQWAADERIGWGSALRFALRKWMSYCAAPLMPIAGALMLASVILALGWIMQFNIGLLVAGLAWPLVLIAGFIMAVLLLGALLGWPLMWGAISVEGSDAFDALSRSYAYTFQRPLHYLFYIVVASVIGWLGWLLVQNFAAGIIWLGYWAAGWGSGVERIDSILGGGEPLAGFGHAGAMLVRFWTGCVKLLAVGYLFSYFWTASTVIYLLLRRDVDHAELDEVFLDADLSEPTPELAVGCEAAVTEPAPPGENADSSSAAAP